MQENLQFNSENQQYIIQDCIKKIQSCFKTRIDEVDSQESSLSQIVELKLYSYCHYLRKIKFGGFRKWIVLS